MYRDNYELIKYILRENSSRDNPLSQMEISTKAKVSTDTVSRIMDELSIPLSKGENTNNKKVNIDVENIENFSSNIFDSYVFFEGERKKKGTGKRQRSKYWSESIFSNGELAYLLDCVLYSKILTMPEAEMLIKKIEHIGGKALRDYTKHKSNMKDKIYKGDFKQKNYEQYAKHRELYCGDRIDDENEIGQPMSVLDKTQIIREAIKNEKKISFILNIYEYDKNKSEIRFVPYHTLNRTVIPYDIVLNEGRYFLVGSDSANKIPFKYYRIDLMTDVKILKSSGRTKQEDNITITEDLYKLITTQPYIYSGNNVYLKVKVLNDDFTYFVDTFGTNFKVLKVCDDYKIIRLYVNENSFRFYAMLHLSGIEILEEDYRETFTDELAETIAKNYPEVIEKASKILKEEN